MANYQQVFLWRCIVTASFLLTLFQTTYGNIAIFVYNYVHQRCSSSNSGSSSGGGRGGMCNIVLNITYAYRILYETHTIASILMSCKFHVIRHKAC